MKATIKQIVDFYDSHPEYIRKIKVNTRFGYKTIEYADVTAHDSLVYEVVTETGKKIYTSPDHKLYDGKWIKVKNIKPNITTLYTKEGKELVTSIIKQNKKEDLYDLQVEQVREFYANGLVSHNSTMIEAISYSLFGKPFRNINKAQLVNSINNRDMVTTIEFSIGNNNFRVIRGQKPNIFEIYQNNVLVNQNSTSKDYQKHLENNILKLNHKSFHQIVVLGSSSFVPFMELPASSRRQIIEDLLDIQIFSKMNVIVKEKSSALKTKLKSIDDELVLNSKKIKLQEQYISNLNEKNEGFISNRKKEIFNAREEILAIQKTNEEIQKTIEKIPSESILQQNNKTLNEEKDALQGYYARFIAEVELLVNNTKFFENNDTCPVCTQSIESDFKVQKINESKNKAKELNEHIETALNEIKKAEKESKSISESLTKISKLNSNIFNNNQIINRLQSDILEIENEIHNIQNSQSDITIANKELESLNNEYKTLSEQRVKSIIEKNHIDALSEMLKDSGIKTKVISEYLPVMNTLINKYLQILNFFVLFNLDSNFSEVIKSRYRDDFSYSSFSEGEKQRIDLALLFAWRQIAKMKNSISTNLLIMDEIMDASIDAEGLENLQQILGTLSKDTNSFIISHRPEMKDKSLFNEVIGFRKVQNFSEKYVEEGFTFNSNYDMMPSS